MKSTAIKSAYDDDREGTLRIRTDLVRSGGGHQAKGGHQHGHPE